MRRPYSQILLKDPNILRKIVRAVQCPTTVPVFEIGPGEGDLTQVLLDHGFRVLAVEIDERMIQILQERFEGSLRDGTLHLIHGDFLKVKWSELLARAESKEMCVVSNIPYAITGPIIERLVEAAIWLPAVHLTVQWEVAQRLVAQPGTRSYGALSVMVQTNYDTRLQFKIKRTSFRPVPDVDSGFVVWIRRNAPLVPYGDQPAFFVWVRKVFQHRRKTLRRIFKDLGVYSILQAQIPDAPFHLRPEDLDIETFYHLYLAQEQALD